MCATPRPETIASSRRTLATLGRVLLFGLAAGLLILAMRLVEYRFLVVEHSVEIYGALIAAGFAAVGIWLGLTLTRETVIVKEVEIRVEVPVRTPLEVPADLHMPATSPVDAPASGWPNGPADGSTSARGPFTPDARTVEEIGVTPRELEVLQLIAEGLSTREMAARLFVSDNTIKTHCSRLFDKLGVNRRTQAVQAGKQRGLLP